MGDFSSEFPAPPPHYRLFESADPESWPAPPAPPEGDTYTMFGQTHKLSNELPTLSDFGCAQLFDNNDNRVQAMRSLNRSLLQEFLKLIELLIQGKSQAEQDDQIGRIRLTFLNLHYLLNECRPHEARENLKLLAQAQLAQRQQTVADLREACAKVRGVLDACAPLLVVPPPLPGANEPLDDTAPVAAAVTAKQEFLSEATEALRVLMSAADRVAAEARG